MSAARTSLGSGARRRLLTACAILPVLAGSVSLAGRAQQPQQTPQQAPGEPRRATTVVMATNRDLRPATGLACQSFAVFVSGTRTPTLGCTPGAPIALAILVDATRSISYFADVQSAIRDVASRLRPQDRASVAWFGREYVPGEPLGRDRDVFDRAGRAIWKAKQGHTGNSPLWDALNATLTRLEPEPGFRAVLVITDGRASGNLLPFEIVLNHAVNAAIPVSFLMPNLLAWQQPSRRDGPVRAPWERPVQMARTTGGLTGGLGALQGSLRDQLRRMIAFHQSAYQVAFETTVPADGRPVPLEIRIGRPGLTLSAPQVTIGR